jgi:hypothetical protein
MTPGLPSGPGLSVRSISMFSSGYIRMNSDREEEPPLSLSLLTSTPSLFAAALIFGMALSPNGDCGARARALRTCAASWTGKCRSERGTVLPDPSLLPPPSMYAKSESGRSLMLPEVISARWVTVTDDLPVDFFSIAACCAGHMPSASWWARLQ